MVRSAVRSTASGRPAQASGTQGRRAWAVIDNPFEIPLIQSVWKLSRSTMRLSGIPSYSHFNNLRALYPKGLATFRNHALAARGRGHGDPNQLQRCVGG